MKLGRMFLGLVSGLTFGMLFAPKKGKDLRKEILKKSGKSPADGLKALGDALIEAGSEAYAEFVKLSETDQVQALKKMSKEKIEELVEKAEERGQEIAEKIKTAAKGVIKGD